MAVLAANPERRTSLDTLEATIRNNSLCGFAYLDCCITAFARERTVFDAQAGLVARYHNKSIGMAKCASLEAGGSANDLNLALEYKTFDQHLAVRLDANVVSDRRGHSRPQLDRLVNLQGLGNLTQFFFEDYLRASGSFPNKRNEPLLGK